MSQPPGPAGGYGPGPYPPPGQYPGPGPYAPPPPGYGPPEPPRKNNALPWLIVGAAVLLSGVGILLVVLLRGEDTTDPQAVASSSTSAAPSSSAGSDASGPALPGGAQVAEEQNSADQSRYEGSHDAAMAWVQAMADGEFQTAFDLSCPELQASAAAAAAGGDPAWELGTYFFEQTLSGRGFTDGSFDSITYDSASDTDIASFTLQLDTGEVFLLLVYVLPDGTVCDFL